MTDPGEDAVERRVQEILARPDLPAFSEHIQQILCSAGREEISIRHITQIVLREYSVSLKLLRTANSPLYNRSGKPILSVSHAASLVGMEAIRDLAASMILFEHFRNRSSGVRELMMLSLLTANHAREAALEVDYPRPEEAYLCGMFRNLGEILVACYHPNDYRKILIGRKTKLAERHACRKTMQFTFEDLGRAMGAHWGLPETVTSCMSEFQPGQVRLHAGHKDLLQSLVQLGHTLTHAVYRSAPDPNRETTRQLVELYRPSLGLQPTMLKVILDAAADDAKETAVQLRMPFDSLRLAEQIQTAIAAKPVADEEEETECRHEAVSEPQTSLETLESEIDKGGFDLNDILLTILERVLAAGPFARVLFGLVEPDVNLIQARLGVGGDASSVLDRFRLPLSIRGGPLGVEMLRKRDLFALKERAPTANPLQAKHLLLCPVIVNAKIVGCLYADSPHPLEASELIEQEILNLRDLAAVALSKAGDASMGSRDVLARQG